MNRGKPYLKPATAAEAATLVVDEDPGLGAVEHLHPLGAALHRFPAMRLSINYVL